MSEPTPQNPAPAGDETVSTPPTLEEQLANVTAELQSIKSSPMYHISQIIPLNRSYDFEELLGLYDNDEMNCFGALLGELELPLKRLGVNMGVNQARTVTGEGRESSSGVSKKGSVEFGSVEDVLHLPPQLLGEMASRGLIRLVLGNTSWLAADDQAAEQANSTTGKKFSR